MPIYEYVCSNCGKTSDVLQKVNDPAPEKCEICGAPGTLSRVVSRTSFVLKGGGWYSDLYGSSKGGTKKDGDGGGSGSGGGSGGGASGKKEGSSSEKKDSSSSSGTGGSTTASAA